MNQQTKLRIEKDCQKFFDKHKDFELNFNDLKQFVLRQVRIGQKEILADAIKIFDPHKDEPMTGNVVNLELKGLRGDFKH